MIKMNLKKLARFLVKAKIDTYASVNKMKIEPERLDFDELEYEEGDFYYRDSYVGFFQAPGMEVVRLNGKKGKVVWTMAYGGGMKEEFHKNEKFAKEVFGFLKEALKRVSEDIPFRGPKSFEKDEWKYINKVEGDIKRFFGFEKILYKDKEVFSQEYIGGLVIDK
ncbi:hypothetical protein CL618_00445 [archaeon]|nr:hypothetical protein [archaeon]